MRFASEFNVRVLTHNIRYATSSPFRGEKVWAERKQLVLNELQYHTRYNGDAFICLQEVLHLQLMDIMTGLNSNRGSRAHDWAYIGVGRDDGLQAGEYSPIFYRPSIWHLQHWETVWLSETPSTPSKGWDAASIRIVTIGVFTHRTCADTILAMNTHLDDQGARSRLESARIIDAKIREYRQGKFGELISGVFLAGDLNSEENQEAYSELTESGKMRDAYKEIDPSRRYGDRSTYTGFGYEDGSPSRIDYILLACSANRNWRTDGYAVLPNRFDDGNEIYSSDHRAVVADLALIG